MKDLTKGKPWKVIVLFALPIFIGNLFNLAYNLADTRIIGTYLGNEALAAVGSVSTLSDLLVGFIVGCANGFAVVTAQFFGMGDKNKVKKTFANSVLFGLAISISIMIISILLLPKILEILNVLPEHIGTSSAYITVIISGLVFSMLYNVMAATLRAIGDAYTPLIFLIISAVLNVVFDIMFVGGFEWGVGGAAVATVLSQFISAVSCFIYTWKKYPLLRLSFRELRVDKNSAGQMLSGGFSMGMMSCLVSFGTVTLQSAINSLGTNIIVAHSATRKLTGMYMLPFGVLGTTMATYCGQNFGARRMDRVKAGLKAALGISYVWCVIVLIASYTVCPYLIVAITDTTIDEVINTATLYQKVDTLVYFLVPTITILRNSLQGIGDHITPIVSSSMELVGKMCFALILTPMIGYWGIILSEPVVWAVMVIPLIFSMGKRLKKYANVVK